MLLNISRMKKWIVLIVLLVVSWVLMAMLRLHIVRTDLHQRVGSWPGHFGYPVEDVTDLLKSTEHDSTDLPQFLKNPIRKKFEIKFFAPPKEQYPYAAGVATYERPDGWKLKIEDWFLKRK